ncbi:Os05g0248300 [Oryza sativa Japonica Group]|uniref:Os05g0248300 protein n=1 Tax=Oryza sativa subsp. japonica TaxID=39947 RepID=Q0DJN6_ORYSJ|nr:Os05g0248300 [Oryza sativa Japonica Group]|eukprot:NP_001055023.2 Os05g0248300 [Oryza sativa Japonica Group]
MDSDEKEKKRENKETITKKMEIKRIKQTRENIPGLKNETQKDKDINKQGKIQAQIQVMKEIAGTRKRESEEGGINAGETMRRKFQKTGLEEIKRDIQISGYIIEKENFNRKKNDLQSKLAKLTTDQINCRRLTKKNIQSGQNARGGTETPNATSYGAQILYNQYSLLNEDGRLMEAGKMSYTNLMQQIIQSPRVTMQTNEEGIEAYTNLLQTPVAFDNSMILTTSRFSPQETDQQDGFYQQQISTTERIYQEFDAIYNNNNMTTWSERSSERDIKELYESKNNHFKRQVNGTTMAMQSNEHPNEEDIQQNSRNENGQINSGQVNEEITEVRNDTEGTIEKQRKPGTRKKQGEDQTGESSSKRKRSASQDNERKTIEKRTRR